MADPRDRSQKGGRASSRTGGRAIGAGARRSGGKPPAPRPGVDAPRSAAYDVLKAVRVDDAYTNLVLPHVLREAGLSGRDAAFTTELVSGTIRRQGTYDAILRACVDRPLAKVEAKVLDALRLGAHQILGMRVPAHAAISSTVDLVRARIGQGPAGFTNAVLRKVTEHDYDQWVRRIAPTDPIGFAAIVHAHPVWVVAELRRALTAISAKDELDALLSADNLAPKVTLVARPGLATFAELEQAEATPTGQSPFALTLSGGDPGAIPAVAEGRAGVQDEGSQLVALALAGVDLDVDEREAGKAVGERWLDACAGPGGKSALLAALAADRGALLLASERAEHRASLVRKATMTTGAGLAGVIVADGTRPAWAPGTFDRVLIDAPCTGLGALRRRPEARWRRRPKDIADLVPLQKALLERAIDSLRPGGVAAYVTCSPVLAETAEVVQAVLAGREDAHIIDAVPVLGSVPGVVLENMAGPIPGTVQLWPHRHGTDAMFLALVQKN